MTYKPVDTAITMVVGPCIDNTDFKTLEEAIAYDAAGMDISLIIEKTDGTTAVTAITLTTGGTSDWTHKDGGYYEVEVTAAQNVEEGIAYIRGVCTGVLPFESQRYNIVIANIYDSWIKGTDELLVDLTDIKGTGFVKDTHSLPQCITATGFSVPNEYDAVITTLQNDLDTITGTDGVTLATAQAFYAPNKVVPDVAGTAATLHGVTDGKVDSVQTDITSLNDLSVSDIIAGIADGTYDFQEMMRLIFSQACAKVSGGGTDTIVFRNGNDNKDRITTTVDANGNRTATTLDGS